MIFVHPKSLQNAYSTNVNQWMHWMTFVHPKSLQNNMKRFQNAYSISSSHASTVLSVLHDHLCKMLIGAPPGIGFFTYWQITVFLHLPAGVLTALDDAVGRIIRALEKHKMLKDTIILFVADNGGETGVALHHFQNSASNWPLRGVNSSLFSP